MFRPRRASRAHPAARDMSVQWGSVAFGPLIGLPFIRGRGWQYPQSTGRPVGQGVSFRRADNGHVGMGMRQCLPASFVALAAVVFMPCGVSQAEVVLIAADLQSPVATTQPGWTAFALDRNATSPAVQSLQPTAAGASAGISATLDGGTGWDARGLDAERATVSGTSFNDVVSDLWFNRQMRNLNGSLAPPLS